MRHEARCFIITAAAREEVLVRTYAACTRRLCSTPFPSQIVAAPKGVRHSGRSWAVYDGLVSEDDDHQPQTPQGAERIREAARALAETIRSHAMAVSTAAARDDEVAVFAAGDMLLRAALRYAEAQADYTGIGYPLETLYRLLEDEEFEGGGDALGEEGADGGEVVSVLQRHDYAIVDAAAVMAAGRAAHRRSWSEGDESATGAQVTNVGNALYELAHADGWDSLDRVAGVRPVGGTVLVTSTQHTLAGGPETWPSDLFTPKGRPLFRQDDVYGH